MEFPRAQEIGSLKLIALILSSIVLSSVSVEQARACGPDTDCMVGDRHYRISLPENREPNKSIGAIFFAHGYRGSAAGTMRNQNMRRLASEAGVALIAGKSADEDWILPNAPSHRNSDGEIEFDYIEAVMSDANQRFNIDMDQIVMTGFSAGGMMVWNMACARPESFSAFIPISGTFWLKPQDNCEKPANNVLHFHGTSDPVVPLKGRPIGSTHQGSVFEALEMYGKHGDFTEAVKREIAGMPCEYQLNADGKVLSFCTHPGGHAFSFRNVLSVWDFLEESGHL